MTLVFRQLHDQKSSTYTYLLGDSESPEANVVLNWLQQVDHSGIPTNARQTFVRIAAAISARPADDR